MLDRWGWEDGMGAGNRGGPIPRIMGAMVKIMGNKKGACMFPQFFWSGGPGPETYIFLSIWRVIVAEASAS